MARVRAILAALAKAVRRDLKTVGSFAGNNLFVTGVTFLFLKDTEVFAALTAFIGLVLFIPLSADPLRVLPRDRLAVWPLSAGERRVVRILSPWLNPVMWLVVGLALWKRVSVGVCAVAGGAFLIGFVLPSLPAAHHGLWRRLPHFPGPLNQLVRKNLRETLSTLDFWCSAVVSALCFGYRAAGLLPADALLPMTILALLAISTCSQTLFGLDGDGGLTRYRLLPVRGWQILAAKDVPFLLASMLVTLPLAPAAGAGGALCALAIGHQSSVAHHNDQVRWRFSSGVSFGASLFQIVIMTAAAAMVHSLPPVLAVAVAAYLWSAWWYGRALERQPVT